MFDEDREIYLPATREAMTYDADGNLLTDGQWVYTWDGENRLIDMKSRWTDLPDGYTVTS